MTDLFSDEKYQEKVLVTIQTSMGDIELELYPELAPKTVENFDKYVRDGFFNGLIFHRIINGFMIQGGGFDQGHTHKKVTYEQIQNEADNGLSNITGTIAMARTNLPHSATSQFFINVNDNLFLDHKDKDRSWGYCVFGKVIKGMDVVNQIKSVPTHFHPQLGMKDWPVENVVIEKVTIKG
jgi:peptidyl-prolyl cis-trans isomerase B (cyclophilin B)